MAQMFGREVPSPRFGRFELCDRIGHGGMGVVYRAWDPQLERLVAIKVIDTAEVGDALRERALREARSLAKLAHPHVITVFEVGLAGRRVWIAMELVEGTTLQQWLQRDPRPDSAAILRHWISVGEGLLAAHRAGLVHRDVKPSNVLIGDDGRARLIDFGLVHGGPEHLSEPALPSASVEFVDDHDPGASLASTGRGFVGTYRYAAPEQREGGTIDAAADQFSLCACIWESLTGQMPPGRSDALPKALRSVLRRGFATDPTERFASLSELLAALERVTAPPSHDRGRWWAATGLFAVLAGVGATQWLPADAADAEPCAREPAALDGTWDEPRRARLRERWAAETHAHEPAALAALEHGLDAWAEHWHDEREAACEATRVSGSQTESTLALRMACLERQRRSLHVTLETWLASEPTVSLWPRAPALLSRLPVPSECTDAKTLAEVEPLPEPGPEREAVLAGYDRLSRARALAGAGAFEQAEELITQVLTESPDARRYAPLHLELQALAAELDVDRGRIFRAVPRLVELSREAQARHQDVLAAQLRVEAAVAAAGRWSGAQAEGFLVSEAETALRRLARPHEPLQPSLRHAQAALLLQDGRYEEALAGFRDAQAQARGRGDDAQAERERWFVASTLGQLGRYDQARELLEAGHEQAERRWGPRAPLLGSIEFDLAVLALETGDFAAADGHLDRAEAIDRHAFGADSQPVARDHYARAKVRMAEGDFGAALTLVEQALPVYRRELGSDHEQLAELLEARGVLRFFEGDLPGSITDYQAALGIARATVGADHPSLARLESNLGESQAALGRLDQASESFARALAIYGRSLPNDHPELALPLKGRGQVALRTGHAAQAVDDLERALSLQMVNQAEPLEIADIRFSLAQALVAREGSQSPRARRLAEQARDDFERLQLPQRAEQVDAWLRG